MNPVKYLNGLGLVASGKRSIKSGSQYNQFFGPPKKEDKYLTYAGTTEDTIDFMADIIKNTLADTQSIAPRLKGATVQDTCRNVFNFVFQHIQYKPDDPTTEELRRPVRSWADRVTGVDCDCYSIFIGSILSNLNIPFALRMVKIGGRPYYQHVYVVVPKSGQRIGLLKKSDYITIDPVLDTFNEEHPFTEKYDLFMQPIKYLNGVPRASLNGLSGGLLGLAKGGNLYYSEEAAEIPPGDFLFFDGLDYYEREASLQGTFLSGPAAGLTGLGFLKKVWGAVKSGAKLIKKIGGKAIKKITVKKDGTATGFAKIFKGDPAKKAARQENRAVRKTARQEKRAARKLTRVGATPVSPATPIGTSASPDGVANPLQTSAKDMIDIAKSMDKSMGVDQILNVVKSVVPDQSLVSQIIDAKSQANKGLSTFETRAIAADAAKAQEAEITKNVLDQVYRAKQFDQPVQYAGFGTGFNSTTMAMLVAGLALTGFVMSRRTA
jgi:hypothetical protein